MSKAKAFVCPRCNRRIESDWCPPCQCRADPLAPIEQSTKREQAYVRRKIKQGRQLMRRAQLGGLLVGEEYDKDELDCGEWTYEMAYLMADVVAATKRFDRSGHRNSRARAHRDHIRLWSRLYYPYEVSAWPRSYKAWTNG